MTEAITYKKSGDRYIFHKDGIYFSLTINQVFEMSKLFSDIALLELGEAIPLDLEPDNSPG